MFRKSSTTQLEINKIVDEIVAKEKEKGVVTVSYLIERILKKYM